MASIDSMTFDKEAYLADDTITLTVAYTPDAASMSPETFTATDTISNAAGDVIATSNADFVVNEPVPSGDVLNLPTDTRNLVWTKVSDDGSVGVFTATA